VKNPEKYNFKPRVLLTEFIQTFVHLSVFDEFVDACARDSRSFSRGSFEHGVRVLGGSLNSSEITAIQAFVSKV